MKKLSLTFMGVVAAVGVACGPTGAAFEGTIHGQTFEPTDVVSGIVQTAVTGPSSVGYGAVVMRNSVGICDDLGASRDQPNAEYFVLTMANFDPGTQTLMAPTAPGTFVVTAPGSNTAVSTRTAATAFFLSEDAQCKNVESAGANGVSGSITLTGVGADGSYSGSFDVTLDSGDEVNGRFEGAGCQSVGAIAGTSRCS